MSIADKLKTIAENEQKVFEAGKKSEYDRFWDNYQDKGNRTDYGSGFGSCWTSDIFKPKYDIVPISAYMMFNNSKMAIDLVEHLEKLGVALDFSKAPSTQYMFQSSSFTRVGIIDVRASTNSRPLDATFSNCRKLITIDKIYLKTGASGEFNATFSNCTALENVTFEGSITKNGLDVHWSTKLTKASIISIVNALSNTTSGLTVTLSKTAVNTAFETSTGANNGSTSTEWTTLIGTKSNWTISLA